MASVYANKRAIVHQGDGQTDTAAPPDACKTPTPGGPVPIPYVNIARTSDLASGTKTIKLEGSPAGTADSKIATSSGDEAGTAGGGLMSSKIRGKLTWATKSSDVKFEGQGVVRFMDVTQHNGNSYNTAFIQDGGTGLAYGDDFDGPCPICEKSPEKHRIHETRGVASICSEILEALRTSRHPVSRMVAVAVCKCDQVLVAASGSKKPGAFRTIAEQCGASQVFTEAPATAEDLASRAKWPAATQSGIPLDPEAALERIKIRWATIKAKPMPNDEGFTTPGSCAGQKIVASGHVIVAMSEMWYQAPPDPDEQKTFKYKIQATFDGQTAEEAYHVVAERAAGREPIGVASCATCQQLLPLMLCDQERSC